MTDRPLKDIATRDLVDELMKREGVTTTILGKDHKIEFKAEGPYIILRIRE